MSRWFLGVLSVALLALPARAELKLNALFADHAVLQQAKPIPVFGTASPGTEITVTFRQAKATGKADAAGKWKVELPTQAAGGPDTLTIAGDGSTITLNDILVGEVWICSGQSNMGWTIRQSADPEKHKAAANHPNLRLFKVKLVASPKPLDAVPVDSSWKACTPESVENFSAVAYFFGRDLHLARNVPVGLIQTAWGGTPAQAWTSEEALNAEPSLKYYVENFKKALEGWDAEKAKAKYKEDVEKAKAAGKQAPRMPGAPGNSPNSASTLYNAMIHPLLPYRITGAIWYQGESNGTRGFEYRTLFTTMIKDWRAKWGQGNFPFLCVQLAPFNAGNAEGPQWAELREAQWHATKALPNVGMAVITDVGEKDDIHPKKKEPVGARLALLAQAIAYGKDVVANGPLYKSMKVEGNKIVLSFDSVGAGLEARGGPLTGFTICGADEKFVPAQAEIVGNTVVVSAEGVAEPKAVRFGWKNYPVVNLFNKNGLPATPFRTDDFPMLSQPKP
jgi:sialate O-acetylesterase